MGAIVLKYVQLVCVAFFVKSTNCAHINDNEETTHLKIAACVAECKSFNGIALLEECYYNCAESSSDRILDYEPPAEATNIQLYCRDAHRLFIKVNHDDDASRGNGTFVYMLKVKESTGKFTDRIYTFVSGI
jgi:hypothetical protein